MLRNVHKSSICVCFDGKFANMRKEQSFVIYPVSSGDKYLKVQSDRMGLISKDGRIVLTSKNSQYSNMSMLLDEMEKGTAVKDVISPEEMELLREGLSKYSMGNWLCEVAGNEGAKEF